MIKKSPWRTAVSTLNCFVVISFPENYYLTPYTINFFSFTEPMFHQYLDVLCIFSSNYFDWKTITELHYAAANTEIPSLSYSSGCCMIKESNGCEEVAQVQWEFLMMWQIFDCIQWLEATILMIRSHPAQRGVRPVCI